MLVLHQEIEADTGADEDLLDAGNLPQLAQHLQLEKVCVVPGNADCDDQVLSEVGRNAALRLRSFLQSGSTLAVTGGSTMREVAFAIPHGSPMNVMVVPARGGIGRAGNI